MTPAYLLSSSCCRQSHQRQGPLLSYPSSFILFIYSPASGTPGHFSGASGQTGQIYSSMTLNVPTGDTRRYQACHKTPISPQIDAVVTRTEKTSNRRAVKSESLHDGFGRE